MDIETTTPSLVATINHERVPVLLTREEEFDTWLRGSTEYPPEQMRIAQEGSFKEDGGGGLEASFR